MKPDDHTPDPLSQHVYYTLFEAAPMGILLVSDAGNILQANPTIETFFGYSRAHLTGKPLSMLLPERFHEAQRYYLERFFADPDLVESADIDLAGLRQDGTEFLIEIQISAVETKKQSLAVLFVTDITKRRHLEEELNRYIRELNAFAHTVAHDLKDPLGILIGYAEMLRTSGDTISEADRMQSLYSIAKYGRKLNNIIDELLLLADERHEVEMKLLDTPRLIHEALLRLSYLIQEREAEVIAPDETAWPAAWGHGPWVEEIWANYISNAVKYGGGANTSPRVELGGEQQPDSMARFWVRDNGAGLSPEQQASLFAPFTRLDERRLDGHGLGLSIVQRIAERLDGQAGVESTPGKGSLFWFTLPGG